MLSEVAGGSSWARDRFAELYKATRKLHSLTWSKGLKSFFGIVEVSDQEITDNKAGKSNLVQFIGLLDDVFNRLTYREKAILRNKAAVEDYYGAAVILRNADVKRIEVYL